jgi:hypothetical protein
MALLRDRKREIPYWKSVLKYCVNGNLQAVLDEYAHLAAEPLLQHGYTPEQAANKLSIFMQKPLLLRTSTAQADFFSVSARRVRADDPIRFRTRFAMRFGDQESESGGEPTRADDVRMAFNSPFWPFVLATTSVGQEGLDFHPYCHAVVHWNLPSNPVDLEQREGRVHRYKGHALRKNIAAENGHLAAEANRDFWAAMFANACKSCSANKNEIEPFWVTANGAFKIERHWPAMPLSREIVQNDELSRALVMYRMVFGQSRQDDLMEFLKKHVPEDRIAAIAESCRLSLAPPQEG